jgi:hypothetical protein
MRRKRVTRLYNKIIQIVQKGSDSMIEYYNFIEDVIANGEYTLLQDVFSICFNNDITMYNSINDLKIKSFIVVQSNTFDYFQINRKGFYDANRVYQVGKTIYDTDTNTMLGEFTEKDRMGEVSYNGITYSYYPENIYYKNTELFHKNDTTTFISDETRLVLLEVLVGESAGGIRYTLADPTMRLLDKYKQGISLMKNGQINNYVDVEYVYNYFI